MTQTKKPKEDTTPFVCVTPVVEDHTYTGESELKESGTGVEILLEEYGVVALSKPLRLILHKVESSNVRGVGYADDNLYVMFKGGSLYRYYKVPAPVFTGFLLSESKGRYFARSVKGAFESSKVN